MASAFNLFCSHESRLWKKYTPLHKLLLQRTKKIHTQTNSCARKTTRFKDPDKQQTEKWIEAVGYRKLIWRPLAFTVMTGAVTFTGCAILQYETVRQSLFGRKEFRMPSLLKMFILKEMEQWWKSLLPLQKTVAVIITLNTVVLLLWKIPNAAIQSFMLKWFVTCPAAGSTVTLLTSSFSHMSVLHLGLNMMVLWSLAPLAQALLGREQFLAFYITAGVFASCASNVFSVVTRRFMFQPSLGASGGIIGLAALFCIYKPDLRFSLIFLPFLTFPGGLGLLVLVGVDVAGLILRWRMLDHAGHLGGVLFGACYLMYGRRLWAKRSLLQEEWHKLRGGSRKN